MVAVAIGTEHHPDGAASLTCTGMGRRASGWEQILLRRCRPAGIRAEVFDDGMGCFQNVLLCDSVDGELYHGNRIFTTVIPKSPIVGWFDTVSNV